MIWLIFGLFGVGEGKVLAWKSSWGIVAGGSDRLKGAAEYLMNHLLRVNVSWKINVDTAVDRE